MGRGRPCAHRVGRVRCRQHRSALDGPRAQDRALVGVRARRPLPSHGGARPAGRGPAGLLPPIKEKCFMSIHPFTIAIPQETLDDLRDRLAHTRWPDEVEGAGWEYGTNLDYLKELTAYWQHTFDWRAQEAGLNQFAHFKTDIDGHSIHFIHERGKGPHPHPLILFHGWPDSFYRYFKVIEPLTDPARFGADPADAFDVIVPSLPGFGFSDRPTVRGWRAAEANALWAKLMSDELGYRHYGAAGGDTGSPVAQLLALTHPQAVVGIHLTDIGWHNTNATYPDLTP